MTTWIFRCKDCGNKIRSANPDGPDDCPHCGAEREIPEIIDIPQMPFISTSQKTKATDKVYRDIEAASERRAEAAAEMAGVPVSEMAGLKVTNLRDNLKPGEIAAPPVTNAVTQQMDMMKARGGVAGFVGSNASEYSGAVQQGPAPNMGAKMRTAIQSRHSQVSMGTLTSDRPALETTQPGYRHRG